MKFLVDRCAGHRLAVWPGERGYDVVESRERGPDPGDRVLLEWAVAEQRILVTIDKDIGEFIYLKGSSHCGLLRLPDIPSEKRIVLEVQPGMEYFSRTS